MTRSLRGGARRPARGARRALQRGVVLFARTQGGFLGARTHLDEARLAALAPGSDPAELRAHLEALERIAAGDEAAGPLASLPPSERFGVLVAPSSTVLQPGEVHTGVCENPAAALERLFRTLVLAPEPPGLIRAGTEVAGLQ